MGRIQRTLIHETGDSCQADLCDSQNRTQHGTVSRQSADITDTVKEMDFLLWTDFYGRIMNRQRKALRQIIVLFGERREP